MTNTPPVVYLLHGEDEFAIAQFVAELKARLGDPSFAEMNTTVLDGRSCSFDELVMATRAIPFLVPRRLVIFSNPLVRFGNEPVWTKFLDHLSKIPPSTALVLLVVRSPLNESPGDKKKFQKLEDWALKAGSDRIFVRSFNIPAGAARIDWIQKRALESGGKFTPQAAALLASQVGEDMLLADQEIQKLLAYTNLARPVEAEDVDLLTPAGGVVSIFAMVDALGNRNGQQAIKMFHHLLAGQDVLSIFSMVVRQFRLLLLSKEILEMGGNEMDIVRLLKVQPFVAKKMVSQARKFSLSTLELIYRRLLEFDVAHKSGELEAGLAIDTLIADLTA